MKQYKMAGAVLITVPMFFLATFSTWAEPEPGGEEASATAPEVIAPADAVDTAEVAETTGLDIVMDGSSLEAYEKSLEKVRETGSEADYKSLKAAFEYLLFYDLGAQRNREKLAARLDGTTGHEIIKRVRWRKP
ncbi:MAG: hypothetical protein V3S21_09335 [Xanthomonadales bacterium]